jgi:hypothetical protein
MPKNVGVRERVTWGTSWPRSLRTIAHVRRVRATLSRARSPALGADGASCLPPMGCIHAIHQHTRCKEVDVISSPLPLSRRRLQRSTRRNKPLSVVAPSRARPSFAARLTGRMGELPALSRSAQSWLRCVCVPGSGAQEFTGSSASPESGIALATGCMRSVEANRWRRPPG